MYRLDEQSVWYDEYISVCHAGDPDLATCIQSQRQLNWNLVPVYYALQYVWANTVTKSIPGIRFLSIIFGMLGIPLIYLLGCDLFGRRAGLVAALCLSLSSIHVFQAQELRNYSLTMLLALASGYTFVKVLREGSRAWWALNFAANVLLVWTHLFGCFMLVAEGCFLLARRWREGRLTGAWFGGNLLLMTPSLLWIRTIPVETPCAASTSLGGIITSIDADCAYGVFGAGIPNNIPWQAVPPAWTHYFDHTYTLAGTGHLAALLLAIAYVAYRTFRRAPSATGKPEKGRNAVDAFLFPLCWLLIPPLTLWAVSMLWRADVLSAKYTTYSSIAAYLLIGGAAQHLRGPLMRRCCVCVLILLYGHQLGLTLTHPQRTDWRSAVRFIKTEYAPGDVFIAYPFVQDLVLAYNLLPLEPRVMWARDTRHVCEQGEEALARGNTVWAVFALFSGEQGMCESIERYLGLRGLAFSKTAFYSGAQALFVYRIAPGPGFEAASEEGIAKTYAAATEGFKAAGDLVAKGRALEAEDDVDGAVAALRAALAMDPLDRQAFRGLTAILAEKKHDHQGVADVCRQRIACDPHYVWAHSYLGTALRMLGEDDAALEALETAIAIDPEHNPWVYGNLTALLLERNRFDRAIVVSRQGIGMLPDDPFLHSLLGRALTAKGAYGEAIGALRKALETDPQPGRTYWALALALVGKGDLDEALGFARRAFALEPELKTKYERLMNGVCESGKPEAVAAEIARLRATGIWIPRELSGETGN